MSIPEVKKLCPCCTPGLKSNQSLLKVDTELGKFYRGPVLAWGGYCGKDDEKKASTLDLGPMDFRHLVDELRLGYSFNEEATRTLMHSKDIYAVRLNCEGDQRFLQRPTMEAVYEQSLVLFTESQVRTPVADRIGIPLIVYKAKPAPVWRDRNLHARMKNHKARMLNPPEQSADTGSLILVRKDGKPLHPTHVHALISYTAVKLVDPTRSPDACITADILHADRVDQVSREDFEHWYHDAWQKYPLHSRFVPSPFDIQEDFHDPAPSISFQI
ncbi:hypothetical protein P153DRAFT_362461 [Dothidotthia symphoricarpi CBS 119687]|uniref:Uncharacterized protein n=1 Tax=Dothidotthia symphoricarpi CBS 119687 TaxID=1392245 RepID=A0A6A6AU56_9PLEO|nr:uncharacterized protein P153DRAFT_362461 [Dothidotthia symphoricarpi CBS 119687]KAF2134718.1 hypothetical protein P153DRAFT_362461 [Dothidotthia symphoricarpi CBS 119687]